MKKVILIIVCMLFLVGCTNINNLSYDELIQSFAKEASDPNVYRTGYKYYLPQGMQVSDSTLYNEVIEDEDYKYYLYIDLVSYYNKVKKEYPEKGKTVYSKSLNYKNNFGYLEINLLKNNKYLVEIMYNYAKIEVIVDKENSNKAVLSAINILKSIEYNDNVIANLLGDDILNFYESEFDIFDTKGQDNNYITVDGDYIPEESNIPDPDLIN